MIAEKIADEGDERDKQDAVWRWRACCRQLLSRTLASGHMRTKLERSCAPLANSWIGLSGPHVVNMAAAAALPSCLRLSVQLTSPARRRNKRNAAALPVSQARAGPSLTGPPSRRLPEQQHLQQPSSSNGGPLLSRERLAAFDAALSSRAGGPAAAVAELERWLAAAGLSTAPGPLLEPNRNRALIQARSARAAAVHSSGADPSEPASLGPWHAPHCLPQNGPSTLPLDCRPASTVAGPTVPWPTWRCCRPRWPPGWRS